MRREMTRGRSGNVGVGHLDACWAVGFCLFLIRVDVLGLKGREGVIGLDCMR
jgi:hypothetical protein